MASSNGIPEFINSISDDTGFVSDYGNELMLYYLLPSMEPHFPAVAAGEHITLKADLFHQRRGWQMAVLFIPSYLFCLVLGFSLLVFLYLRQCFIVGSQYPSNFKTFTVLRSKAALSKISQLDEFQQIEVFVDDLFLTGTGYRSLYDGGLSDVIQVWGRYVVVLFSDITALLRDIELIKRGGRVKVVVHFVSRVPFKLIYQLYLERIIKKQAVVDRFITGEKEDRYAVAQSHICLRNQVGVVCYPHGLEYGFRMPIAVNFSVFYCNSEKSRAVLESLDDSLTEFKFDRGVVEAMFGASVEIEKPERQKVVFFPESRGVDINREILRKLVDLGLDVFLKIHPLDKRENYLDLIGHDWFIDELDVGLTGNICIARKSTILLEAEYRGSVACAILINQNDKFYVESIFPALSSEGIQKFYTMNELEKFLKESYVVC